MVRRTLTDMVCDRLTAITAATALLACGPLPAGGAEHGSGALPPLKGGPRLPGQPAARPVEIGSDGFFVLNGQRRVVWGLEEEHHRYTREELEALVPRLKALGVTFLVLYRGNPQEDFFYERLAADDLWVAQELGNVKKPTRQAFAATGGVIGTLPDEATVAENLARIDDHLTRLAKHRNILFWWIGGEFAEPEFHTREGVEAVRASVRLYGEAVRARDPLGRPFTVSHHYVEALESLSMQYVDYADLTDFTWFTLATHFHLGDFVGGGGWLPVARASEVPLALEPILARAHELNGKRPIFLAGFYAQAPLLGPCTAGEQAAGLREKWRLVSTVPHVGGSVYHLSAWDGNAMPHAIFEQQGRDWNLTSAGETLKGLLRPRQP